MSTKSDTRPSCYCSSKARWSPMWRAIAAERPNIRFISSWTAINESDEPDPAKNKKFWVDLWLRNIDESRSADVTLFFVHAADRPQKGAWVESGSALSHDHPVFFVREGDVPDAILSDCRFHPMWREFASMNDALDAIEKLRPVRTSLRDTWPPSARPSQRGTRAIRNTTKTKGSPQRRRERAA
jgi:hypothetical protein